LSRGSLIGKKWAISLCTTRARVWKEWVKKGKWRRYPTQRMATRTREKSPNHHCRRPEWEQEDGVSKSTEIKGGTRPVSSGAALKRRHQLRKTREFTSPENGFLLVQTKNKKEEKRNKDAEDLVSSRKTEGCLAGEFPVVHRRGKKK